MTLSDTQKVVSAAVALLVLGAGSVTLFQTQSAAAEQAAKLEQQQAKSVNELRAEFYLAEIAKLNAKEKLTKDEQDTKERYMALVKAIEAERVGK